MKDHWRNLDGSRKKIVELRGVFEFSRPKVAQTNPVKISSTNISQVRVASR